ncbi:MAG: IS1595 family transposase [Rhodospirillales bacterium]|nr:IS1595 family transposase [Rhodospirillales bacterium]
MKKAPGKAYRDGVSIIELMAMFPTEEHAIQWFEDARWGGNRSCAKCGNEHTRPTRSGKPMPYWCGACRSYFSVRTGTPLACSNVPLRKWAVAIYLCLTSLKSVSSMKLHRDINVSQKAAWFMLHRIRDAWSTDPGNTFSGPVEVDETYVGGIDRNRHKRDRKGRLQAGGKTAVVGAKDRPTNQVRAHVVPETHRLALRSFVRENVEPGATLYTDEAAAYQGEWGYAHEAVKHSVGEYVRGMASTNGVESFWSMLKRAHKGTFHKISPKHLNRYVQEFAGKHNFRESGTLAQMRNTVARLVGHRLLYRDLIAPNGLPSLARR